MINKLQLNKALIYLKIQSKFKDLKIKKNNMKVKKLKKIKKLNYAHKI